MNTEEDKLTNISEDPEVTELEIEEEKQKIRDDIKKRVAMKRIKDEVLYQEKKMNMQIKEENRIKEKQRKHTEKEMKKRQMEIEKKKMAEEKERKRGLEVQDVDVKTNTFDRKRGNVSYECQKQLFEKEHFKVDTPTMYVKEWHNDRNEYIVDEFKSWKDTYQDVEFMKYQYCQIIRQEKLVKETFINFWLKDINKRVYKAMIMDVDPKYKEDSRYFNIFKGFDWNKNNSIENLENIQPMLYHIKHRLCHGIEEHYEYAMNWLSYILQKPHLKTGVAFVMKSQVGAGKGLLVQLMGNIQGKKYFCHPTNSNDILGNFNGLIKGKTLLYLDELAWGGDKSASGILKKLITEESVSINKKNVANYEIKSYMNVMISSNEEWIIPAIKGERRFFVLKLSDELSGSQDNKIKEEKIKEILNVKPEHFAHYLYNRDISNFNVRKVPVTEELREQQMNSYSNIQKWWSDILGDGCINWSDKSCDYSRDLDSSEGFLKDDIINSFQTSNFKDKYMNNRTFWKLFGQIVSFKIIQKRKDARKRSIIFPSFDEMEKNFGKSIGDLNFKISEISENN